MIFIFIVEHTLLNNPVDTRRLIDAETTSCVYWESTSNETKTVSGLVRLNKKCWNTFSIWSTIPGVSLAISKIFGGISQNSTGMANSNAS